MVKGSKTVVDWVEEENYMFRLSEFRDEIRRWLSQNGFFPVSVPFTAWNPDVIRPKHYLPIVLKFLEMEEDLSISRCRRRLPWGIAVPDDAEQTVLWFSFLKKNLEA